MRRLLLCCLAICSVLSASESIPVIAGSSIVQDLAARIGGERFVVTGLVGPGISPHAYQPVPDDVRRLAAARLVVINGLGFEGWFEQLAAEARFDGTVVVATAGIQTLDTPGCDGHAHAAIDPHPYNSIRQGVRYAENIRDALLAADPQGADGIRARAAAVIEELRRTDAWATTELAAIPRGQRKIITDHDALAYFARDYGFEILALGTALENSQPSARQIAELVGFIRKQGVKGVFLEQGRNPKLIEQLAAEAGVRVGAALHLDGLGAPGTPAGSYVGMFRANVEAILAALR